MRFTFGGVDFSCKDATPSFHRTLNDLFPLSYVSFLVAKTYGEDTGIKQQVLDALSPFQIVSKAWAVNSLRYVPIFRSVYYPGSWLGQLPVAVQNGYQKDYNRYGYTVSHVLIDKDPVCSAVASVAVGTHLVGTLSKVLVQDIYDLAPVSEPSTFVWTGLEHFDLEKVRRWVRSCPTGTTFLFQGTDMPAEDHVSPISSPKDILSALEIGVGQVKLQGSLSSCIGNRHQVVFTL